MKKYISYSWIVILLAMGIYNAFNPTTFDKNMCNLIGVLLIIFAILMKFRKGDFNEILGKKYFNRNQES
ncbi:hypothetical protein BZK37_14565 [Enterococcus casseliflavus]|nr:hypothetical protein BZK37_14565 [Enterococcus casseliflavus]